MVFTGIVQERGRVASFEDGPARRRERRLGPAIGDSVAVDGVCLTVRARRWHGSRSTSCRRRSTATKPFGDEVNLEPALRAGDPLGGHYVQGHVDGVGTVRASSRGRGQRVWIDAPATLLRYIVEKGSIAVDGVSLTVAAVDERGFAVALVPHTLAVDDARRLAPGRHASISRPTCSRSTSSGCSRATISRDESRGKDAVRHHRGGDRGHPRRASSSSSSTPRTARTRAT